MKSPTRLPGTPALEATPPRPQFHPPTRHRAGKRGGAAETLSLDDTGLLEPGKSRDVDVVALDDALKALAQIDPRKAQVVELRFFGGLNFDETAEVLKVSAVTVARDWSTARAWLHREMSRGNSDGR